MELRSYQNDCIAAVRQAYADEYRAPLLVAPTGSGKTVMFSYMASRLQEAGKRLIILVHRAELMQQVCETLNEFGVDHGRIDAGSFFNRRKTVNVASVFTLARRLQRIDVPDYVVVDEAHHAIATSTWGKVLAVWRSVNPRLRVLGVTATPERLSGEGLGETFDMMLIGPSVGELIEQGALAPYRLFAPAKTPDLSGVHSRMGDFVRSELEAAMDKPAIIGDAVMHYRKHCDGAPALAFCVSIEHAKHTAEQFAAQGYRAMSIDGKMDATLRATIIKDFRRGAINVLTSCELVSEGFDLPGIHAAILLRPTQSLAMYLQQVGRALRPASGKDAALILDHVGNSSRHGLPDDERQWSLAGRPEARKKNTNGPENPAIRQCDKCFACSPAAAVKCRECGAEFTISPRVVEQIDGELAEVIASQMRRVASKEQAMAETLESLVALGRQRGFKHPEGWAKHVFAARQRKRGATA